MYAHNIQINLLIKEPFIEKEIIFFNFVKKILQEKIEGLLS